MTSARRRAGFTGTPQSHSVFVMNTPLLPRAEIGIVGLDDVINGGLARNRLHLLEGSPGTGKTTIALQFLMAGARQTRSAFT
jgi:predicted ATP-dependent serine protease